MVVGKSVRVHDDTHRALKRLKSRTRSASLDQVIREAIKASTGDSVKEGMSDSRTDELTKYLKD
jgi:predicted transcriptional regulator